MRNLLDDVQNVLLMGPGPSCVAPSTYNALSQRTLGHLDPYFIQIMDEIKSFLKILFNTRNRLNIPLSGTGSAGMQAAFVNTVERGDKVLVLQNGVFGKRMADVAGRLGAQVTELTFEWGKPVDVNRVAEQLKKEDYQIVAVVHAETSTGVCNPVQEIGDLLKGKDTFYLVDTVTSLGGMPVEIDKWGADLVYSGSQKCLSCPPGLAPFSLSHQAAQKVQRLAGKVSDWYLDLNMLIRYWEGGQRVYHHTAPVNMIYAMYQSLWNLLQEGPDNVFARHRACHERLVAGLADMGWEMLVEEKYRLPMLNAVIVPDGIDEAALRHKLRETYHIEIGAGLGALSGKIVRIGLMGYSAQEQNVDRLLNAMREICGK